MYYSDLGDCQEDTARREFLERSVRGLLGSTLVLSSVARVRAEPISRDSPQLSSPEKFKSQLAGPILSLPTTFHEDLSVNYEAVQNMVDRAVRCKVPVFELTSGNSMYDVISYDEIKEVTRAMVQAVDRRGLTIAATGGWEVDQVIDYASFSEDQGATALQVLPPEAINKDEISLLKHFKAIASKTRLPLVLQARLSVKLLHELVKINSIVAMKEDYELEYYIDRLIEFGDRLEIFSGGGEFRYLVGYPYGARSFFSTYTSFAPEISMRFWRAIKNGDLKRAVEITKKYDYPLIKRFSFPFWHASLEYFQVAERYMRPPYETYSDVQMTEVKEFFDGQGIEPDDHA